MLTVLYIFNLKQFIYLHILKPNDSTSAGCAQGTSRMLLDWGFLDLAHWHFATQGLDDVPLKCAGAMHPLLVACSLAFTNFSELGKSQRLDAPMCKSKHNHK